MQLIKHDLLSESDLLARLQRTRLRGFVRPAVYGGASRGLVGADPEALAPAQRCVLREGVQAIRGVADGFAGRDIDVVALRGGLLFWREASNPESDGPIPFLPPVI